MTQSSASLDKRSARSPPQLIEFGRSAYNSVGYNVTVVFWQKFDPEQFEFDVDELAAHRISVDEAVEVIWNGFEVRRNKR